MTAPTNTERERFEAEWAREIAANSGVQIGADYRHWMRKGWEAGRADSQAQIASVTAERDTLRASIDALFDLTKDSAEQLREERDEAMARVVALEDSLEQVESLLTNLQPKIASNSLPGRAGFIDNYVDPALEQIRAALAAPSPPTPPTLLAAAQRVIRDRDNFGWSTEADAAIQALREVLEAAPTTLPAGGKP